MHKTKVKNPLCFKKVKDREHNIDYSFYFHSNIVGVILVEEHQYQYVMWKDFLKTAVPTNVLKHLIDDMELLHKVVVYDDEKATLAKLIAKAKRHKSFKE